MNYLEPQHIKEFAASGIPEDLAQLNFRSIAPGEAWSYLFQAASIERTNTGMLSFKWLRNFGWLDATGGWVFTGVNPLDGWSDADWTCFKPDVPRADRATGKPIKYEHPVKERRRVFFPKVTGRAWKEIAAIHKTPVDAEDLALNDAKRQLSFWRWVEERNLDITITEGAKKAVSLIAQGYVAIGLPGINGGCRRQEDKSVELIPELEHLTVKDVLWPRTRRFFICFDNDTKKSVITARDIEIGKLGAALDKLECEVFVLTWTTEKGIDDYIATNWGCDEIYENAISFAGWQGRQLYKLTYRSENINRRYVGKIDLPKKGCCFIKSPKNTGKTEMLIAVCAEAYSQGKRVLVVTHRRSLGRAICKRLGLAYIEDRDAGNKKYFGYGLCGDSLHPLSQARFNPLDWSDAILIFDEIEQVNWHMVSSGTCYDRRASILNALDTLIKEASKNDGLLIGLDADLSDVSIDYIKNLWEGAFNPYVLVNDYKLEEGWKCLMYNKLQSLYAELRERLRAGEKTFVLTDSQKVTGIWASKNLETLIAKDFPQLRILRIDAETIADPSHPAFQCVEDINEIIKDYDVVIASPTIGTGVSIDTPHFQSEFAFFKGVLPTPEALQFLARYRPIVERHICCPKVGLGRIGNGSSSWREVFSSKQKNIKANLHLLHDIDFQTNSTADAHVTTYCKMAARINAGMWRYQSDIIERLVEEGHDVEACDEIKNRRKLEGLSAQEMAAANAENWEEADRIEEETAPLRDEFNRREKEAAAVQAKAKNNRDENQEAEDTDVRDSQNIAPARYSELKKKQKKTRQECLEERKHFLQTFYALTVLPPELHIKDLKGWHPKIELHYYLTTGSEYLEAKDRQHLLACKKRGSFFFDIKLLTAKVAIFKRLGFFAVMDGREFKNDSPEIAAIASDLRKYAKDVKHYLNLSINQKLTDMGLVQYVLGNAIQAPLALVKRTRTGEGGDLERWYAWKMPIDGREGIFSAWVVRDLSAAAAAASAPPVPASVPESDIYIEANPGTEEQIPGTASNQVAEDALAIARQWVEEAATANDVATGRSVWAAVWQMGERYAKAVWEGLSQQFRYSISGWCLG